MQAKSQTRRNVHRQKGPQNGQWSEREGEKYEISSLSYYHRLFLQSIEANNRANDSFCVNRKEWNETSESALRFSHYLFRCEWDRMHGARHIMNPEQWIVPDDLVRSSSFAAWKRCASHFVLRPQPINLPRHNGAASTIEFRSSILSLSPSLPRVRLFDLKVNGTIYGWAPRKDAFAYLGGNASVFRPKVTRRNSVSAMTDSFRTSGRPARKRPRNDDGGDGRNPMSSEDIVANDSALRHWARRMIKK